MSKTETFKIEDNGQFYGVVGKNNRIVVPFVYDEIINTFSSGLINVCKNDKWGCFDLEGNIVIPLVYDWMFPFGKDPLDTTSAKRNGKWGIIDRKGGDVIPCVYDEEIVFKNNRAIVSTNGKMGMINQEGIFIIPCQYSYLKPFVKSPLFIKVIDNNKSGIFDLSGNTIIPTIYDEIEDIYNDFVIVKQSGCFGVININGEEVIPCEYEKIDKYHHDISHLEITPQSDVFSVLKNNKWKYVLATNKNCNVVLYDWISELLTPSNFIVKQNKKYGLINNHGEIIVPVEYNRIEGIWGYYILDTGKKKGLCDAEGQELIPICCGNIQIISKESAIVIKDEKIFLFFFDKNKEPVQYDEINRLYGKFYKVILNGKCGVVDVSGDIIEPLIYDDVTYDYRENTFQLYKNGTCETHAKPIKKASAILLNKEYDSVEAFYEQYGIYLVGKTNKMGVVRVHDGISETIVPIEYDKIEVLFSGIHMLLAKKAGQYRMMKITKNTKTMFPFYDKIGPFYRNEYAPVYRDGLMGVINNKGEEIVPVQYEMMDNDAFSIFPIDNHGGCAFIFKKGDKLGVFKHTGELLLPFEYNEIEHLSTFPIDNHGGCAFVIKKGDKLGVFKHTGELLLPFEYAEFDYEGIFYRTPEHKSKNKMVMIMPSCDYSTALIPVKENNGWGLVDSKFKFVVPCVYRAIRQDTDNKLILLKKKGHDLLVMTKDGPQITYTATNKLEQYSSVRKFNNGFGIVRKDNKYGYINEEYDEIVPCIYDEASPFEFSCACVKKNGKYGYIDKKGDELTPCVFDEVFSFNHGISIVRIGELFGAINNKGETVIPIEYQILADFSFFGPIILVAVKDKRFGAINLKNKIIVPFEYDLIESPIFDGMIKVSKNGKKGVFNKTGILAVPIQYDEIEIHSAAGSYSVCNNGKWGVLNKKGEEICEPRYDKIDSFGFACERLAVCRHGKWGFINRKGVEVIECKYDEVFQFFEENHCQVKLNGKKIWINIHGERIG